MRILSLLLALLLLAPAAVPAANAPAPPLPVEQLFDRIFPPSPANMAYARLLTDNVDAWYARWHILENAKKTIDVTYFIVEKDVFGLSMIGLLKKKAAEGVKVRLLMDARGTKELTRTLMGQDYMQELLENPNVEIRVFNPLHTRFLKAFTDIRYLISSNHDKIVIADGEWVVTGGRNIAAHYFVDPRDNPHVYRDTCVLLKGGEVARQAKLAFDEEFARLNNTEIKKDLFGNQKSRGDELEFARRAMQRWMLGQGLFKDAPPPFKGILSVINAELGQYKHLQSYASFRPFQGERAYPAGVLDKHSFAGERNDITDTVCRLMDACQKEIIIQNPYVILTERAKAAIDRANKRGVKVIIHTNSPVSTDSLLTQAFFLRDWKALLGAIRPNLQVFAFKAERKLHSKTFVFDRAVTLVGTYNMDYMSEGINSEEIAAIKARPFGMMTALRIWNDIRDSLEYKVEVLKDGSIKEVYGPKMHSPEKTIRLLEFLGKLGFLKTLI